MNCFYDESILLSWLLLLAVYILIYTFILYAKGNPAKHHKWKNQSIKTNLASINFIYLIKDICLQKKLLLLEISPSHAFIKQNPSWSHWGAYYYIELNENNQTATVWCRGGLWKFSFRLIWITDMLNLMYV